MEIVWAILLALAVFVGIPALVGLLITGAVVWYNKHKTKRTEQALTNEGTSFVNEVVRIPGGEGILQCIQCGTCAGTCPNADEMQHSPRKIIAMVRAGLKKEVLSSDSIWYCASCYLCSERCPRGVKVTELMYALKQLAYRYGFRYGPTGEPIMYRTFVDLINQNGRVHELGLTSRFYMQTKPMAILRMAPIGLKLIMRGRSPLRPRPIKDKEQLVAIITKARALQAPRAIAELTN